MSPLTILRNSLLGLVGGALFFPCTQIVGTRVFDTVAMRQLLVDIFCGDYIRGGLYLDFVSTFS